MYRSGVDCCEEQKAVETVMDAPWETLNEVTEELMVYSLDLETMPEAFKIWEGPCNSREITQHACL